MWSFADLTRALYSAIEPPTLLPIGRSEPKTYTFFILRILTLALESVPWVEMEDWLGRNDRFRQNQAQYVSISSICFKMRNGSNDISVAPVLNIFPKLFDLLLLQNQVRSRSASRGACGGSSRNTRSIGIEVQHAVFF